MQSSSLNLKWAGGTAEALAKTLHGIEEISSVDLQALLKGGLLMNVFTGDDNKMLLIRECVTQVSEVLENFETKKFLQKKRIQNEMQEEDLHKEAVLLLESKIKSLNKTLSNKNSIELPMGLHASGSKTFLDFTPVKSRKITTTTTMVDQHQRETIVRNLQFELDSVDFTPETIEETKLRLMQKKLMKEGRSNTPSSSVSLKAENDVVLTKYFRILVRQLLQESVTGKNAGLSFAFTTEVNSSTNKTIVDTDGCLEKVRRKMFTTLSNCSIGEHKDMLPFVRKMKSELQTYLWLCRIYKNDADVIELRKDVHEMLSGKLDTISADANLGMHMLGQCDQRVSGSSPSMTKYEFYVEYLESTERAKGVKPPVEPIAKPTVRLTQPTSQSSIEDDQSMTELKTVAEGLEGTFNQMRVLLAGGTISKSPTGEAILEKLTEFQTKMSETFFKKKSEEEGSKKPIKSSETKKGSDKGTKRSRKGKDSESESDSEKEEPKSNKKSALAAKMFSMDDVREIMKIGAEVGGKNSQQNNTTKNVCFDFKKGNCKRGSSCHFEHTKDDQHQEKKGSSQKPCYKFQNGNCNNNNCSWSHDQSRQQKKKQNEELLCATVTKDGFCTEQACKNVHGKWKENASLCNYEKDGKPCPFLLRGQGCNFNHEKMCKKHNNS